jgi:hypothetical protein
MYVRKLSPRFLVFILSISPFLYCLPFTKSKTVDIWVCLYFCETDYGFLERKGVFYDTGALKPFAYDHIERKFDPLRTLNSSRLPVELQLSIGVV